MRADAAPAELLEDSVEAYFCAGPGRAGLYTATLLALAGAAAALPFVRVDVTERAPGMIRPTVEQHRIAAPSAGTVHSMGVRLGQQVRAGDVLLTLHRTAIDARLAADDSAAVELRLGVADLERLLAITGALGRDPREAQGRAGPVLPRYALERRRIQAEWADLRREVAPARAQLERTRSLARSGLAPPAEVERAALAFARAESAPTTLTAREQARFAAELARARASLVALDAERAAALVEARGADVRTPVTGTVESLAALSPGSWVTAGDEIAVVSPDAPLVAELYVDPHRIGRIRTGLPVHLRVDAFDHHQWGTLPAVVTEVARDYTVVGGRPVFRVRCKPLRARLTRPGGSGARPDKGMTVTASVVVGRRSLAHLLWMRAADAVDAAGG